MKRANDKWSKLTSDQASKWQVQLGHVATCNLLLMMSNEIRATSGGCPVDDHDFWRTAQSNRQHRPAEPAIDIELVPVSTMMACRPAAAPVGQPEGVDKREAPLPSMTMAAENEINGVPMIQVVEYIRGVGQQDGKAARRARRDAPEIGAVQGWIVEPDNSQLASLRGNKDHLVDQQVQLVPVRQLAEPVQGDAAVMVMVAQGEVNGSQAAQARQEPEEVREPLRDGQEIAGHEDPIRSQAGNRHKQGIMAGMVTVQMQVADLNRPAPGQGGVPTLDVGDLHAVVADFGTGKQAEEVMQGEGDPMGQGELKPSGPAERELNHSETRLRAARSRLVNRYPLS